MKTFIRLLILATFVGRLFLFPTSAAACSCPIGQYPSKERFDNADYVFLGEVQSVTVWLMPVDSEILRLTRYVLSDWFKIHDSQQLAILRVDVIKSWKGVDHEAVLVRNTSTFSCGVGPLPGMSHLFFAYADNDSINYHACQYIRDRMNLANDSAFLAKKSTIPLTPAPQSSGVAVVAVLGLGGAAVWLWQRSKRRRGEGMQA